MSSNQLNIGYCSLSKGLVIKLRKIGALIKYEIIDARRGLLLWLTVGLYAFGVQQAISSMFSGGISFLSLVGLIRISWLPLNFIMIPVMLLGMKIGQSENEIFKVIDISQREFQLSKIVSMLIIDGAIFAINSLLAIAIAILNRVSIGHFLYQMAGYTLNTVIFLLVCSSVGLFIGWAISRHVGEIISFIVIIVLFYIMCNLYKMSNGILPLIDIRSFPGSFDVISYDMRYLYHNIFWIVLVIILFSVTYIFANIKIVRVRSIILPTSVLMLAFIACSYLALQMNSLKPTFYNITSKTDSMKGNFENTSTPTFFSKENCGYYIDKYKMDLSIDTLLKNNCDMEIKVSGSRIDSLELGLFEKLKISKVEVDGQQLSFDRTSNSFIVTLPRKYNNGEAIKMNVTYEGKIDTIWKQGMELFFARNNALFLADVFEWYPKLNDNVVKDYNVILKYNSNHKVYSNLDLEVKSGEYSFTGKDTEIFLIGGNITERKYKNYLFIGNEEHVNNDGQCDNLLNSIAKDKSFKANKAVFAPLIPGGNKMGKSYDKAYLYATDN